MQSATIGQFMRICSIILALLFTVLLLLPLPKELLHPAHPSPKRVLDRYGEVLYEVRPEDAGSKSDSELSSLSPHIVTSLIATEDQTFYRHPGVSLRGTVRAFWQNLTEGRVLSGGSTITQQLVRNRLQSRERTISYKLKGAFYALRLEMDTTKEEILAAYLNESYFGHQAYGIAAAADVYFGKSPSELSLAESALLIGLLQSPSVRDPYINFDASKERQTLVLKALLQTGKITKQSHDDALKERILLADDTVSITAPHFVMWVLQEHGETHSLLDDFQTTLDAGLQADIERIVRHNLELLQDHNVTSAAVVVLDVHTGDVLSMVGSSDFFDQERSGSYNVALASRQPGSALKPFTYALVLLDGDSAATTVADTFVQYRTQEGNPYTPRNYSYQEHGLVRYREALSNSYNIAAVKVLEAVGVDRLQSLLTNAGITTLTKDPEHYGLALTLGDGEVKLLELAKAYSLFPRGGAPIEPRSLLTVKVEDHVSVLPPDVSWIISDILSDNTARIPEFGLSSPLSFPYPVAAKTGTTRNNRDNWVVGYSPDIVVGVWVGNADNSPMRGTSGVTGAGPIFRDTMERVMQDLPKRNFKRPANIVEREICTLSGKLPTEHCPETMVEVFREGNEPTEFGDVYQMVSIDTRNGLRASQSCDPTFVVEEVFPEFPLELRQWAREAGYVEAPTEYSSLCLENDSQSGPGPGPGPDLKKESDPNPDPIRYNEQQKIVLEITHPLTGDSFRLDPTIPDESEKVVLTARASDAIQSVRWYSDDEFLVEANAPLFRALWTPEPGWHSIRVEGGDVSNEVRVEVIGY